MRRFRHLWLLAVLLFSAMHLTAQNGKYDARFNVKAFDCGNKTATIQLQVRATDAAHTYNMGDANYRFEYDPRLIARPRITAQPNFSSQPPASDFNYGTQNLNGSSAGLARGLVSVNTFYQGSANGAKRVDTAWITVSEIAFDVVNIDSCFKLEWHDAVTFPVSGMSEVAVTNQNPFAYDLVVAQSSGVWQNVQACFKNTCVANQAPSVVLAPIVVQDSTFNGCYPIIDPNLGDVHTVTVCGNPRNGTARATIANGQVCISYTPNRRFSGQDSICLTICDQTGLCTSQTWPIRVTTCYDTMPPTIACPMQPILVSAFGEITNNSLNFLAMGSIGDNCTGVKLTYNTPTATDNCTTAPSVILASGLRSGSNFPAGMSTISFTARDSAGLASTCTVQIIVAAKPTRLIATTTDTISICQNDVVDISPTPILGATYRWSYSNGFTSPLQRLVMSATLLGKNDWLRLTTTVNGCVYKDSVYVKITPQPIVVNDTYQVGVNVVLNGNVATNDTLAKGMAYNVSLVSGVGSGTLVLNKDGSFIYNATKDSTFSVNFVYKICYDACPATCQIGIAYINVLSNQRLEAKATNVITPNGDGSNETLVILNFDPNAASNQSSLVVYNQWGDVVYRAAPYRNDWDGKWGNNPLPDATYYFIFRKDPLAEPIKDFVTIIR